MSEETLEEIEEVEEVEKSTNTSKGKKNKVGIKTQQGPKALQINFTRKSRDEIIKRKQYFICLTSDISLDFITLRKSPELTRFSQEQVKNRRQELELSTPERGRFVNMSDIEAEQMLKEIKRKGIRIEVDGTCSSFNLKDDEGNEIQDPNNYGWEGAEYPLGCFSVVKSVEEIEAKYSGNWRRDADLETLIPRPEILGDPWVEREKAPQEKTEVVELY